VTQTQQFIALTVAAVVCIVLGVASMIEGSPFVMPDPWPILFILAGIGALGVQVKTGANATASSDRIAAAFKD
jgi:hypothetical protein